MKKIIILSGFILLCIAAKAQEVSINSRFAVNDMRVLAQACKAGLGIALLPQLLTDPLIANGQLVQVLPTYRRASSELGLQLVYTSRPPVPPAVGMDPAYYLSIYCGPMSQIRICMG